MMHMGLGYLHTATDRPHLPVAAGKSSSRDRLPERHFPHSLPALRFLIVVLARSGPEEHASVLPRPKFILRGFHEFFKGSGRPSRLPRVELPGMVEARAVDGPPGLLSLRSQRV